MSAHAITGSSWTPWDTKHAKGVAAAEMTLPERPENIKEADENSAARQVSPEQFAEQVAEAMSSALFAALLDEQEYTLSSDQGAEAAPDASSSADPQAAQQSDGADAAATAEDEGDDQGKASSQNFGEAKVVTPGQGEQGAATASRTETGSEQDGSGLQNPDDLANATATFNEQYVAQNPNALAQSSDASLDGAHDHFPTELLAQMQRDASRTGRPVAGAYAAER